MRIPHIGCLYYYPYNWMQRIISPFRSEVVILLYHRIFDLPSDPHLLSVHPDHFTEHLKYLSEHYPILTLKQLAKALKERHLPKRVVVLTFDDGYADNLWNAKPLLQRYGVPATVFVVTGYIGQTQEFWWNELERLLLSSSMLPECLSVTVNGKPYEWQMGEWAQLSQSKLSSYWGWNMVNCVCPYFH